MISDVNIDEDKLRFFGATSLTEVTSEVTLEGNSVLTWNTQQITLQCD